MATRRQDYDYLIKLLLIGDSGGALTELLLPARVLRRTRALSEGRRRTKPSLGLRRALSESIWTPRREVQHLRARKTPVVGQGLPGPQR